jgi:hypothetical protein
MQHYHNASEASLNTCILYITSHRGLKHSGLTASREVGTIVGRNVNRSHKHTTIMYYFSTQICKLCSFVNSWNKDDGLSRLKLCMNNSQKHRRSIIRQTIFFSLLFNDAVNCYDYTVLVKNEWMEYKALVEKYWQRKKPVPVLLCPSQIPHILARNWTQASAVTGRKLTAWSMAWPKIQFSTYHTEMVSDRLD